MCKITNNFNIHELWDFESSLVREKERRQELSESRCSKEEINVKYLHIMNLYYIQRTVESRENKKYDSTEKR